MTPETSHPGGAARHERAAVARNGGETGTSARPGPYPVRTPPTRKGRDTLLALKSAARVVFERDGFLAARITDIAEESGLAYGSFYNYFDSKEEIFWAVLGDVRKDMFYARRDDSPRPPTRTTADQLRALERANIEFVESFRRNAAIIRVLEEVATYNDDFRNIRREARTEYIRRIFVAVKRLQERGTADRELDAWATANALGAMMDRFCYAWFVLGDEFDDATAITTLNRLWLNALGVSKSRRPAPSRVH